MLPGHPAAGTVALERQRDHLGWQGQGGAGVSGPLEAPSQPVKPHPGLGNEISKPGFKKRKFDRVHSTKVDDGITQQSKNTSKGNSSKTETSASSSKENSKAQKTDYIHVRARRGQATDSHSLAERARREKISQRMKYLQDLVPGCSKITGKAGMLDEIINYVQSLQGQVEFLSMKLAAVNPTINWNIDGLFGKEVLPTCKTSIPAINVVSPEIKSHPTDVQSNPVHQAALCPGMEPGIDAIAEHRASMSSPSPIPETLSDPPILLDLQQLLPSSLIWETDLQNLYSVDLFDHGSVTSLGSHQLTGSLEISDLKREM